MSVDVEHGLAADAALQEGGSMFGSPGNGGDGGPAFAPWRPPVFNQSDPVCLSPQL